MSRRACISVIAICLLMAVSMEINAAAAKPKVGVSVSWSGNDFVVTMWETAQQRIRELGGIPVATSAEGSTAKHISDIESLIVQGVKAIIIQPYDTVALVPVVKQANRAKIPVICMDGMVAGGEVAAWVGSNNVEAGERAARFMVEKMGGKGNIAVFWSPTHSGFRDRYTGLEKVLAEYPLIKVVAKHALQATDPVPETRAAMENILMANPDIGGVFSVYDMPSIGASQAIEAAKKTGITVVGVDGDPMAYQYIKEGRPFAATSAQSAKDMGNLAAELAMKIINGEKVPEKTYTPVYLVTKDNVDQFLKPAK